jgi:hypothetical protein
MASGFEKQATEYTGSGVVLRGIGGSQIYVTQSQPLARMKG